MDYLVSNATLTSHSTGSRFGYNASWQNRKYYFMRTTERLWHPFPGFEWMGVGRWTGKRAPGRSLCLGHEGNWGEGQAKAEAYEFTVQNLISQRLILTETQEPAGWCCNKVQKGSAWLCFTLDMHTVLKTWQTVSRHFAKKQNKKNLTHVRKGTLNLLLCQKSCSWKLDNREEPMQKYRSACQLISWGRQNCIPTQKHCLSKSKTGRTLGAQS